MRLNISPVHVIWINAVRLGVSENRKEPQSAHASLEEEEEEKIEEEYEDESSERWMLQKVKLYPSYR